MAPEPETTAKRAELPMRLTRLRVKNFRSISDIDIPLSPLTVLVGPNGSGKSNVVDALRFVRDVFARGLSQAVKDRGGMKIIKRWHSNTEGISFVLTINWPQTNIIASFTTKEGLKEYPIYSPPSTVDYGFTIDVSKNNSPSVVDEYLVIRLGVEDSHELKIRREGDLIGINLEGAIWRTIHHNEIKPGTELLLPKGLLDSIKQYVHGPSKLEEQDWFIPYWYKALNFGDSVLNQLFYTINPADLRQPQQILEENPFDEKGLNMAAVLRNLFQKNSAKWNDLRFALRQTITGLDSLEVEAVGGYLATKLIYKTGANQYRDSYLGQESEGTMRMLGLLTALYQDPAQPFICIEEPEANIHPGALAILAGALDEASLHSQILGTTHSPDMLDHLPVESFLVVEKVSDTTHVGPLDASQIASVRKRLFTPSELFRMEGLQRQPEPDSVA